MPDTTTNSRPLTPAQAARRLGCSDRQARRLLARGELKGWRVGADWRTSVEAVEKYKWRTSGEGDRE